jgi:hypothetical protein
MVKILQLYFIFLNRATLSNKKLFKYALTPEGKRGREAEREHMVDSYCILIQYIL